MPIVLQQSNLDNRPDFVQPFALSIVVFGKLSSSVLSTVKQFGFAHGLVSFLWFVSNLLVGWSIKFLSIEV